MADFNYFTHSTANVDKVLASTMPKIQKTVSDNIYSGLPVLKFFLAKNKKTYQSGASILYPIQYAKNSTAGFYDRYDVLDVTPQEEFTDGQYKWRQAYATVSLAGKDLRVNQGPEQVFSLLKNSIDNAVMSVKDQLSQALFASSQAANKINSLVSIVSTSVSLADHDPSTDTWWQSTVTASGSFAGQGLADMRTLYNTIRKHNQSDPADLIVTTQSVEEYYENEMSLRQRIVSTDKVNLGFENNLMYKTCTILWDENATSGVLYMLNTNHMEFIVHKDADFTPTEWVKPANQDVKSCNLLFMGNLCTNNRRTLGKLTGITA